jgi:hypothetical protein
MGKRIMDINPTCKLVQKDVYLYDISSCHYRLLKNLGFDLSNIDKDDKLKRNTQIGLLMREHPNLIPALRNITNSTISEYILRNNVSEDDLILRAYDGIIVKRTLKETTDNFISIDMQANYDLMVISSDRQRYISTHYNNVIIKGVPNRYSEMDKMLKKLAFGVKGKPNVVVFEAMQKIKDEILNSENVKLFCIPGAKGKFNIFLKAYGDIEISETMIKLLTTEDVDKERYFDYYIRPFCESITIEYL